MENRFDLHTHSIVSDGTATPYEVVAHAARANCKLMALTDHDNIMGVQEAVEAGKTLGVPVLPAVEMDNEWHHELHIIGLDIDPNNPTLLRALEIARERREKRNKIIYSRLKEAGYDVQPLVGRPESTTTKLHIAHGLIKGGFANDVRDAFAKYLRPGQVGYYTETRFTPQQVIEMAKGMLQGLESSDDALLKKVGAMLTEQLAKPGEMHAHLSAGANPDILSFAGDAASNPGALPLELSSTPGPKGIEEYLK